MCKRDTITLRIGLILTIALMQREPRCQLPTLLPQNCLKTASNAKNAKTLIPTYPQMRLAPVLFFALLVGIAIHVLSKGRVGTRFSEGAKTSLDSPNNVSSPWPSFHDMMQLGDDCGGSNSCAIAISESVYFLRNQCDDENMNLNFFLNSGFCSRVVVFDYEVQRYQLNNIILSQVRAAMTISTLGAVLPAMLQHGNHDASHCNAPLSCTCTKNDYQIISIKTTGKPQIKSATQQHFKVCCPKGASSCGVSNSVEWSQTQTLSWSSSLTESIELSTELEIAKFGITLSGTYTNGGSTTRTVKSSVTVPCKSTTSGFDKLKLVDLSSTSSVYTIPITMTATHCGAEVEMPGTVAATTIDGTWDCEFRDCKGPCDNSCHRSIIRGSFGAACTCFEFNPMCLWTKHHHNAADRIQCGKLSHPTNAGLVAHAARANAKSVNEINCPTFIDAKCVLNNKNE
eukprot:jgi/Bigna1/68820/fgenesh1_pg.7_\